MSRHSQGRASVPPRRNVVWPALATGLGAVLSGVSWTYLVRSAIGFGRLARGGQPQAWLVTGASSLGAVVCAVLVLVLVARTLRTLGILGDYRPRRAAGRRRAR